MTFEAEQEGLPQVCPYLGLADDADSHATYATEAHRCYRLPTPTRIATGHQEAYCLGANHPNCPVYQGEGVTRTTAPAPAPAAPAREPAPAGRAPRAPAPAPAKGPAPRQRPATDRPRRPPGGGAPRPRAGGISMPVATIGLFVMAVVVIGIALLISQAVGDDDGGQGAYDPGVLATTAAQKTAQAAKTTTGSSPTQATGSRTPTAPQTPGTPGTPGTATTTRTGTPGAGGKTYKVVAGDTCGGIATAHDITLEQLLKANGMTEDDCATLQIGQELKLP